MSDTPSPDTILELRGISVAESAPYDSALNVDLFVLKAGELAAVEVEHGVHRAPMVDVSSGLLLAAEGQAVFEGKDWPGLSPNEAGCARHRIGRVFDGRGSHWISNLDVDENMTLAMRFHHGHVSLEAQSRMEDYARMAECWPLPEGRPVSVSPSTLRRIEWVRAFMGDPSLLILERPLAGVFGSAAKGLVALVERARDRGAAILWVAGAGDAWHDALKPSSRWRLAAGRLESVEME